MNFQPLSALRAFICSGVLMTQAALAQDNPDPWQALANEIATKKRPEICSNPQIEERGPFGGGAVFPDCDCFSFVLRCNGSQGSNSETELIVPRGGQRTYKRFDQQEMLELAQFARQPLQSERDAKQFAELAFGGDFAGVQVFRIGEQRFRVAVLGSGVPVRALFDLTASKEGMLTKLEVDPKTENCPNAECKSVVEQFKQLSKGTSRR